MIKATKALAKRRTLFAVVLALTIFGAVYGFAATLGVASNNLSAGNTTVASCETGSVTGTYTTAYDSTLPGFKVASVVVNGVSAPCATKTVSVTLTDSSNAALGPASGTVGRWGPRRWAAPRGGTVTLSAPASPVSAALVANVNVAING
jgi:hypothetical protein